MDDGLLMDLFVVKGGRKKKLHSVVWYKKKKEGKTLEKTHSVNPREKLCCREDDNASGVGYDPPDGSRDLDLGFLVPLPSGFNPGEFRLVGSIGNWCTPPLRGSQGHRGSFLLRGA